MIVAPTTAPAPTPAPTLPSAFGMIGLQARQDYTFDYTANLDCLVWTRNFKVRRKKVARLTGGRPEHQRRSSVHQHSEQLLGRRF